jgi:CRISPR-associated protein Cas4
MTLEYTPDELLPLSGIQHFLFCRRQWALIHIEQQWQENALTAEGRIMHERVDDPFFTETRNGVITARAVPVASYRLGLAGVCDVVEFTQSSDGVKLPGRDVLYLAVPIEYKRGKPKRDPMDEAQLCAQAMCLEGNALHAHPARLSLLWANPPLRAGRVYAATADAGGRNIRRDASLLPPRLHPEGQTTQRLPLLFAGGCVPAWAAGKCPGCIQIHPKAIGESLIFSLPFWPSW